MEKNKRIFKLTISSEILVGLLFPVSSSSLGQSSFFFFLEILFFPLGGMLFPGVLCCFLECCEWNGKLLHRLPFIHEKVRRSHIRRSSVAARHVSVSHPPRSAAVLRCPLRYAAQPPRSWAAAQDSCGGEADKPRLCLALRGKPPRHRYNPPLSAAIRRDPQQSHTTARYESAAHPWWSLAPKSKLLRFEFPAKTRQMAADITMKFPPRVRQLNPRLCDWGLN